MQKVKDFFDTYPSRKEVFETADGFLFFEKTDALNHAKNLEDNKVKTHTRDAAGKGGDAINEAAEQEDVIAQEEAADSPADSTVPSKKKSKK